MIRVGVVGATGYAGAELVRILSGQEELERMAVASKEQGRPNAASDIADLVRELARG